MPDPKQLKDPHPFERSQRQPGCQPDRHHAKSSAPVLRHEALYRAGPHAEFQESASLLLLHVYHLNRGLVEFVWDVELKTEKKVDLLLGNTFSNISLIQLFPPLGLFPHLVLEYATRRVKGPASQQILKLLFSWQSGENMFSEADTSSLVYGSLICWWMCCRAFTKLHPCFT